MRLLPRRALTAFFLSSASLAASAQAQLPLDLVGFDPALDGLRYATDHGRVGSLLALRGVTLSAVALPDGTLVDLELERLRPERLGFRYYVDGLERADLLDGLELSIWKGRVRGVAGSDVMLSFSHFGTQGWIDTGAELVHVIPQPGAGGDWWSADVLFVTESALNARGLALPGGCATERPVREALALPAGGSQGPALSMSSGCALRECKISISSDYQYFQRFNDVNAQTAYTTTLWSFISDRYESQASTLLTFPYVAFYTTPADPWTTPDAPGSSGAMLTEFRNAWVGNIPNGGRLGHFMSGAALGGGVAWLDVLCNPSYSFAVSGNLNGTISFPIQQQPNNWDFIVCAHEVGHNFDALHTHDYCPPLDECPPSQYFGACQTQQVCSNQGTIMSYCHLCSGGTGNITTYFHPTSAADMSAAAAACLPIYTGLSGTTPSLAAPAQPTPVSATLSGTPVGPVQVLWRATPSQPFTALDMASAGNGNYTASLPGFGCGEQPEYYYAFNEQSCGTITFPAGAPAAPLALAVGALSPTFQDDFEADLGWSAVNLGATAGAWQRGVPVNDPGWAYDPLADGDGSGSAWLTENALGNTDVDGGSVRLISPALDLSAPGARIEYLYFLRLTVSDGVDALVVQISANGTAGPWVEIARHDQDRALAWTAHTIPGSAISAAGVTLGSNMRLRFTVNDGGAASIVEAGLDGFKLSALVCNGVGVNYCTPHVNSTGAAALVSASGSNSIAANDLVLSAAPIPAGVNGQFFYGAAPVQLPFGNGFRCIASPLVRLGIQSASGGVLTRAIDNSLPPAAAHFAAGTTWHFQAWFRDTAAGGANSDLSDGYRITFRP